MKCIMSKPTNLILLLAIIFCSNGCASLQYTLQPNRPDVTVEGRYDSVVVNHLPITKGMWGAAIWNDPGGDFWRAIFCTALTPITFLADGAFSWRTEKSIEPLRVAFAITIQDANSKPLENVVLSLNDRDITTDRNGQATIEVKDALPPNPKALVTLPIPISFAIDRDWTSKFNETGDAMEYSPGQIDLSVQCEDGKCQLLDSGKKPLQSFVFKVEVISHHDDKIVASYKARLADEERQRQEVAKRQQEEEARKAAEDAKMAAHLAHIRQTGEFDSFEQARELLNPSELGIASPNFLQNPLSFKGRAITLRMKIMQVVSGGVFLLTNYHYDPYTQDAIFMGVISPKYRGSKDFVDGQGVEIVGEIVGTYQYTTAMMSTKTVPEIKVYGIKVANNPYPYMGY